MLKTIFILTKRYNLAMEDFIAFLCLTNKAKTLLMYWSVRRVRLVLSAISIAKYEARLGQFEFLVPDDVLVCYGYINCN
jgi:hypothetical protein